MNCTAPTMPYGYTWINIQRCDKCMTKYTRFAICSDKEKQVALCPKHFRLSNLQVGYFVDVPRPKKR